MHLNLRARSAHYSSRLGPVNTPGQLAHRRGNRHPAPAKPKGIADPHQSINAVPADSSCPDIYIGGSLISRSHPVHWRQPSQHLHTPLRLRAWPGKPYSPNRHRHVIPQAIPGSAVHTLHAQQILDCLKTLTRTALGPLPPLYNSTSKEPCTVLLERTRYLQGACQSR